MAQLLQHKRSFFLSVVLSLLAYLFLAYFHSREDFFLFIFLMAVLFFAYFILLKYPPQNGQFLFYTGLLFKGVFLFSTPVLSDDFYRFIWDGQLLLNGQNPYALLPAEVNLDFSNKELLLTQMNSPNYYSVYPPVLQWVFAFVVTLAPSSISASIGIMRSLIILADLGTFFLLTKVLKRLDLPPSKAFLYFLNPLVILELVGNLHFEALMIFFSMLAIYLIVFFRSSLLSAFSLSLAFLTKLIPLLLLALIFQRFNFKKYLIYFSYFCIASIAISYSLMDTQLILHLVDSLELYFRNFEFNASLYYLLRWIGFQWKGYNLIQSLGPILALISAIAFFYMLVWRKSANWQAAFRALLLSLTLYYLLATTVHPWYLSFLVFLACFTELSYPILWSALVFLSYFTYSNPGFEESTLLLTLEYAATISLMLYELKNGGRISIYFKELLYLPMNQSLGK